MRLWRKHAASLLAGMAYIDVDGATAPTNGQRKCGMDISHMGVWEDAALNVSLADTASCAPRLTTQILRSFKTSHKSPTLFTKHRYSLILGLLDRARLILLFSNR